MGLAAPVLERGRRVETVAFYDGAARQAEVKLSELGGAFPFLVILPQNVLEDVLEAAAAQGRGQRSGGTIGSTTFQSDARTVVANVEELGATGTGYIVPHWETVVETAASRPARSSWWARTGMVRWCGSGWASSNTRVAGPEFFAAYEFEPEEKVEDEVRVVLDDATTNVLWPLAGNRCRWTFQVLKSEMAG